MNKHYLFAPGPVTVSNRVKNALVHEDICHRSPQFEKVFRDIQESLLKVFKADDRYVGLLITGSGSGANETVISTYIRKEDQTLLIKNGNFGNFLHEILLSYQLNFDVLEYGWGVSPNVEEIEARLLKSPEIKSIIMVFHETSTGMINPVKEVGQLAHRLGKTFIVDGVSAVGGEDVNIARDHIDFCTTSANKCLASLPGVGIICAKKAKIEERKGYHVPNEYLNLYKIYDFAARLFQTPHTPSVTLFYALREALFELLEEGVDNRIARHGRCAKLLRKGFEGMGLEFFIKEHLSNTVTTLFLPEGFALDPFIDEMDRKGFTLYPGKGPLKDRRGFQVANMGWITEEICESFLKVLKETLKR